MKKLLFAGILALAANFIAACGGSGEPNLYIEYEESEYRLNVVKYLNPGDNAANGRNIFNEAIGTTTINGHNFYMYHIPPKKWDIYTETNSSKGLYTNDRDLVNLEINDWAKLELSSNNHGDYWRTDGNGEVY